MSKKKRTHYSKKKQRNNSFTRRILKVFYDNPTQVLNHKQIASKLSITDTQDKNQIIKDIEEILAKKLIEQVDRGKYKIVIDKNYYVGTIDTNASGNGYFMSDDLEEDVFVPNNNLNHALAGDLVKCYVYNRKTSKKREGDIVEILKREKLEYVGVIQKNKNYGFLIADNSKMYVDLYISGNKLNGAEHGDKVLAKITDWPDKSKNPFGEVTTILGKPGEHETEIHSILLEYDLPYEFPKEVEDYAATLPVEITTEEIAKRRDMRDTLTFTIDPKDAKDFDDALSFKILDNGNYEIGIHIADVSHYVALDTILEEEAYQRATSVYLVDRVVPMLPEILSNNVCSLRPHEEKLTFSAVFELNKKAEIINEWYGRTVTYSDARFAYEEAQVVIETGTGLIPEDISLKGEEYTIDTPIKDAILSMDTLAKILRKKRLDSGAITFDKTEVRFKLDAHNEPVDILFKVSKDANKLIEEFMLLANRKVASFIGLKKGKISNNTFVYRVHDEPDHDKLSHLQQTIAKFGYSINTETIETTSNSLNKLLEDVKGTPEANMIETLTVRSMSKAEYTTHNIGHYGLAFDYYSHFTSPIRRYPDVMTHRLLQHYLDGGKSPNAAIYEEKCKHSSNREMLASKAERSSIKYMQVKYMQNQVNESFEGVISGVTEWGIYVEINENKCEGMVRIRDIKEDYFIYDESLSALVGQDSGTKYTLGDTVTIKVKKVDLEKKHLDFYLIES